MSLRLGLPIAATILVADQVSKWWMLEVARLPEIGQIRLLAAGPFGLDLTMVWNRGVTFGLLSGDGAWNHLALALLAAAIAAFLLRWMARAENRLTAIALGAVVGGAIGNVIDRILYGAVADFLNMSCCGIANPWAFNVADIAVFAGAIGLVLFTGRDKKA